MIDVGSETGEATLADPLIHRFGWNGRLQIFVAPIGFTTDFFSIPSILQSFFRKYGKGNKAAIKHDYNYAAKLIPREDADRMFRDDLLWFGYTKRRANIMYAGVRIGGAFSWNSGANSTSSVLRARKLAKLYPADGNTDVDPKTIPKPLWPDGNYYFPKELYESTT
jgi:hypothetical protein